MKLKSILLGMVAACCLPFAAQAETVPTNQDYQVSCISSSEQEQQNFNCDSLSVSYDQTTGLQTPQESSNSDEEIAQRTRTRRTRSSRNDKKFYVGTNVGILFPFSDNINVGFAPPNIFGGYKFNKYISADAEFFYYLGGTDFVRVDNNEDIDYFAFGFLFNPRFTYSFSKKSNSIYAFVSPGIGYGRVNFSEGVTDLDGFTLQIKWGAGFPISKKLDVIGQMRYINVFNEGENADGLSLDGGVIYKF